MFTVCCPLTNVYRLLTVFCSTNAPFVCLTETWPNESIPENSVFLGASYTVIAWSDRAAGQHCGLLIALENEFLASENVLFQSNSSFYSCVLLRLPTFILCIVLVYFPPQSSVYFVRPYEFEAMLRALSSDLKTFLDSSDFSTWIDLQWVLLDDFNFPDLCWDTVLSRHSDEQFSLDFISDKLLFTQDY